MTIPGRDQIEELYRGANDGVFTMDSDTAVKCAKVVQTLIDGLNVRRAEVRFAEVSSFGEFESGIQMAAGFSRKHESFRGVLFEFVQAATRLKESFEIAGSRIAAAEDDNVDGLMSTDGGAP